MTPIRILLALAVAVGIAVAVIFWNDSASAVTSSTESTGTNPVVANPEELDGNVAKSATKEQPTPERETITPDSVRTDAGVHDIIVRVVDAGRRPLADFPVAIAERPHVTQPEQARVRARTDANGRAILRGGRELVREEPKTKWYVVHEVCFEHQPHIALDATALRQEVLTSEQPAFGSVRVLVEREGQPAVEAKAAELGLVRDEEEDDPTLVWKRLLWPAPLRDGRAQIDYVELGREWSVAAFRKGSEVAATAKGKGPSRPGEVTELRVEFGAGHPIAVFRAVTETGQVLANAKLGVRVHKMWGGTMDPEVTTDAEGRFEVDCRKKTLFGQDHLVVKHHRPTAQGSEELVATRRIPGGLKNGRNDMGDLVLKKPGVLASGRAFGPDGKPAAQLTIRGSSNVHHHSGNRFHPYAGRPEINTKTDATGYFELVGSLPDPEFHVWADGLELRSDGIKVKGGARNLRLDCYRTCRPVVHVQLQPGTKWDGTEIQLRRAGRKKDNGFGSASAHQQGNTVVVQMTAMPSGTYDLSWKFRGKPIGSQTNLKVTGDEHIATIDLRSVLHPYQIVLHRPDTKPDAKISGTVFWRAADTRDKWQTLDIRKSELEFCVAAAAIDARVYADGFCSEVLLGVNGRRDVTLRPGIRCRLVLETTGKLPKHPYIFDPSPTVDGKMIGKAVGAPYFTEKKREVVFLLPPGKALIQWHLERRMHNGAVGGHVLSEQSVPIDVAAAPAEQIFRLKLDGKALARLLSNLPW